MTQETGARAVHVTIHQVPGVVARTGEERLDPVIVDSYRETESCAAFLSAVTSAGHVAISGWSSGCSQIVTAITLVSVLSTGIFKSLGAASGSTESRGVGGVRVSLIRKDARATINITALAGDASWKIRRCRCACRAARR